MLLFCGSAKNLRLNFMFCWARAWLMIVCEQWRKGLVEEQEVKSRQVTEGFHSVKLPLLLSAVTVIHVSFMR